ncbi:MAG: glycosyltransferase [Phycisphaerales bacterium]|nr:glycosyltransferase [Phycisphaerales bacterium]
MSRTHVEVVIPALGAQQAVDQAVASALRQGFVRRVILVDDGSDPPLTALADRVCLIRQANAGPGAARNRGLEVTSADLVLLLDADDTLLPGAADAIELLGRLNAAAVVSGWIEAPPGIAHEQGRRRHPPAEWVGHLLPRRADVFRPLHLFKGSGILLHRRVVDAGVRFDEALRVGEDREFLYRVSQVGGIGVCDAAAVGYTLHGETGDNLSSPRRFDRRVHDFATIVRRHHDQDTDANFRAAATWLVNQLARRGASGSTWDVMMEVCREFGWRPPLKARVRRWTRRSHDA